MTLHEQIVEAFETYVNETTVFEEKGTKVAGTRARTALSTLTKLAKERRAEIQEAKNGQEKP